MKKRKTIFTALIAFLVLMMGVNFDAEAQLGGLINAAKNKAKANKEQKEAAAREAKAIETNKLTIPQPDASAQMTTFTLKIDGKQVGVCTWWPAKNELNVSGPNIATVVCKIDPATGKVTSSTGEAKGSMSADGTIVSPNFGTLTLKPRDNANSGKDGYIVERNGERIGVLYPNRDVAIDVYDNTADEGIQKTVGSSDNKTVNFLVEAYAYFGLVFTEKSLTVFRLGYDPDKKYTTEELEDMVEWNDTESINTIIKYESSLPCAGFKETHPEFKNCKIGGVGLLRNRWKEFSDGYGMKYWVVYELTDGRNIVTFNRAFKKWTYGEITLRNNVELDKVVYFPQEFHEVTDWVRK